MIKDKEKKNDELTAGTGISEMYFGFIQRFANAFSGTDDETELDQFSVSRLGDGTFKLVAKGWKRAITGGCIPVAVFLEARSLHGALELFAITLDDPDYRWGRDRYPKDRNARISEKLGGPNAL